MKINRLSMLAGAGTLSLVAIICMLFWGFSSREPAPASSVPPASSSVAVFVEGNSLPDEVFDVYIASFPEEEQTRLRQGIRVTDDIELARYLEDYTS